jgi:hypothetical protein
MVAEAFAIGHPQSTFSGSAGMAFSRPGLNIPRQRAPPRSRMASFFRGHRALAWREASLRVEAPVASLATAGRASPYDAWSRPRIKIPSNQNVPAFTVMIS